MPDKRWVEIDPDECADLLRESHLGRIALVEGELPVILPVNFLLHEGEVVFRTNPGSKLDAAIQHAPVAFEIDGINPRNQTGWSVLIRGHAREVTDPEQIQELEQLEVVPWAPGDLRRFVKVVPVETTGRRITVPTLPSEYWG
ncbi:MAG: pyridoxamine 5'-phosphate oxidase family protein [Cellulomonas sp.]|nr:pyridoxamine 5'-phosphate oxidase family protein [Cellulomonas sp.]